MHEWDAFVASFKQLQLNKHQIASCPSHSKSLLINLDTLCNHVDWAAVINDCLEAPLAVKLTCGKWILLKGICQYPLDEYEVLSETKLFIHKFKRPHFIQDSFSSLKQSSQRSNSMRRSQRSCAMRFLMNSLRIYWRCLSFSWLRALMSSMLCHLHIASYFRRVLDTKTPYLFVWKWRFLMVLFYMLNLLKGFYKLPSCTTKRFFSFSVFPQH